MVVAAPPHQPQAATAVLDSRGRCTHPQQRSAPLGVKLQAQVVELLQAGWAVGDGSALVTSTVREPLHGPAAPPNSYPTKSRTKTSQNQAASPTLHCHHLPAAAWPLACRMCSGEVYFWITPSGLNSIMLPGRGEEGGQTA